MDVSGCQPRLLIFEVSRCTNGLSPSQPRLPPANSSFTSFMPSSSRNDFDHFDDGDEIIVPEIEYVLLGC